MKFHDTLNSLIWDLETNDMLPEVKEKLKEIAEAFIEFLEIPTDAVLDKVITGSSASYNYNKYSDLDLHIIVDYDKVHEDCPLVNGYLNSLKKQFNDNHDIFIHGVPVELYAEKKDQGTVHNGLYSLNTGWIDKPQKIEPTDNDAAVEAKFNEIKELVDKCDDSEEATELLEKIYNMRKAGLAEAGEFCTENLAFKKLRNEGCMDKLRQIKKEQIDKQLSLESYNEAKQNYITPAEKKQLSKDLSKLETTLDDIKVTSNYEQDLLTWANFQNGNLYYNLGTKRFILGGNEGHQVIVNQTSLTKEQLLDISKLKNIIDKNFEIRERFPGIKDMRISFHFDDDLDYITSTGLYVGHFTVYGNLSEPYLTIAKSCRSWVYSIHRLDEITDEDCYEILSGYFTTRYVTIKNGKPVTISKQYIQSKLNNKNESLNEDYNIGDKITINNKEGVIDSLFKLQDDNSLLGIWVKFDNDVKYYTTEELDAMKNESVKEDKQPSLESYDEEDEGPVWSDDEFWEDYDLDITIDREYSNEEKVYITIPNISLITSDTDNLGYLLDDDIELDEEKQYTLTGTCDVKLDGYYKGSENKPYMTFMFDLHLDNLDLDLPQQEYHQPIPVEKQDFITFVRDVLTEALREAELDFDSIQIGLNKNESMKEINVDEDINTLEQKIDAADTTLKDLMDKLNSVTEEIEDTEFVLEKANKLIDEALRED